MTFDDRSTDREPHPESLRLAGHEVLEDSLEGRFLDANAYQAKQLARPALAEAVARKIADENVVGLFFGRVANFINSELDPGMIRSMCCRLQLDLRELLKRGNGLFGSAEQTGSLGVVTVNCARLGYLHRGDEAGLFARLDELLELGRRSLEIKRTTIQQLIDDGLYPYTKRYLGTLRNHFSTLGVNGVNEMIRNFTHDAHDITTRWLRAQPSHAAAAVGRRKITDS